MGVNADGRRELVGLKVGDSESEPFWREFLASLKQRGLGDVRLMVSDAHVGLTKAVGGMSQGCLSRANTLWAPLRSVLSKAGAAGEPPVDPALQDYILLITILVAFFEAVAQRLSPQPLAVVMGFGGIQPPVSRVENPG